MCLAAWGDGAAAANGGGERPPAVVHADVVALDHLLIYNRFGSYNPHGMIFALRRDVSSGSSDGDASRPDAEACRRKLGTEAGTGALETGRVRLKDCKRPRPLVLRGNVGDILEVTVTNLLGDEPEAPNWPATRGVSFVIPGLEPLPLPGANGIDGRCLGTDSAPPRPDQPEGTFTCRWRLDREGTHLFSSLAAPAGGQGDGGSLPHGLFGALVVEPEGSKHYRSQVTQRAFDEAWKPAAGPSAPRHARSGPLGYGAVAPAAERERAADRRARPRGAPPLGCASDGAVPVLEMTRPCGTARVNGGADRPLHEVVHADLNAIVVPAATAGGEEGTRPFREFTVIFHDELKTFYTERFTDLERFGQLSGVRDAFAINYGASGAGSTVLANRQGIGPAADCVECLYEEFFLQSWANGDPALLEAYADDPSNVHHSYLNDKVVFRNLHAGPKETHVFHLHTHQWFAGNDEGRGSYLDSQTIAPQQGFTYRIYHGGLRRFAPEGEADGWWESLGAGNRNRTPGDAIFHCHLYPHFAQGMWALWRVHDVLEDGSRLLPDGQDREGLSLRPRPEDTRSLRRAGSVAADGSEFRQPAGDEPVQGPGSVKLVQGGTPVPGVVPLPDQAAPLLPTYGEQGMPGYPFYIAGRPGHRAPQPPLDLARAVDDPARHLDGGLPRHVVTGGARETAAASIPEALAIGDMTAHLESLDLEVLPYDGTPLERRAMAFHHDGRTESGGTLALFDVEGRAVTPGGSSGGGRPFYDRGGYLTHGIGRGGALSPEAGRFTVNAAPAAPGAPFADPCGGPAGLEVARLPDGTPKLRALPVIPDPLRVGHPGDKDGRGVRFTPDPGLTGLRRFEVSAVQLDVVVNRAGWHDPQTRMNVLSAEAAKFKNEKRADVEPFFFRAFSGECVEFRHTNETPKELELDDFQLRVPTDTIGQHIHLVKFDVTSSDGSGNGFNYEDGTFAPDEVLARICAATGGAPFDPNASEEAKAARRVRGEAEGLSLGERETECEALREARGNGGGQAAAAARHDVWKRRRLGQDGGPTDDAKYFQTTVQRWFADPLLSEVSPVTAERAELRDRTLRTVFTHDHFAPSNIQQHGFYSALLVELRSKAFCVHPSPEAAAAEAPEGQAGDPLAHRCRPPEGAPPGATGATVAQADGTHLPTAAGDPTEPAIYFADGDGRSVGARASIASVSLLREGVPVDGDDSVHGDPIHPNQREFALAIADFALIYDGKRDAQLRPDRDSNGLDRLVGEAEGVVAPSHPDDEEGEVPPASVVRLAREQRERLRRHAEAWRDAHSRPVAPPPRPEAISQKHHDPYLVNYRHEPLPLRMGSDARGAPFVPPEHRCTSKDDAPRSAGSVRRQRDGEAGDLANVFRSEPHGDPCTPVLDVEQGDTVAFRLIQGAHEVQHMFTVETRPFPRNGRDQAFPSLFRRPRADIPDVLNDRGPEGFWRRCQEQALHGRPLEYQHWLRNGPQGLEKDDDKQFFARLQRLLEGCNNVEGYVAAQEVGISEHFELAGQFFTTPTVRLIRRDRASDPGAEAEDDLGRAPEAFDYLYHFGTIDALWNGAWGLLRVHERLEGAEAPDVTACLAGREKSVAECVADTSGPRIAARLPSLRGGGFSPAAAPPAPPQPSPPPAAPAGRRAPPAATPRPPTTAAAGAVTPSTACPPGAPQVLAAVAAVQAHEIPVPISDLPGLVYSPADGLFDPDGLMLVAVDPARLGVAPESLFSPAQDPAARPAINRHDILRAAGAALRGPDGRLQRRPLVLRANAGDCLRLAVLNGLPRALTDARGDALMPPIVPLNVDQRPGARADDLRPSARIALIIPTSHVTPGLDLPVPFGLNPGQAVGPQWAEPGGAQGANWYGLEVYAGRLVVGDGFDAAVRGIRFAVSADGMDAAFGLRNLNPRNATRCRTDGVAYDPVVIVGQRFCLAELATADRQRFLERFADTASAVRRAFRLEAARLLREREQRDDWEAAGVLHKIPYAFGPLPIKALGDPIGHGVHGLTGTVVVEPRGASYPNRPGDPAPDDPLVISRAPAEPTARIETADAAREVSDPQEPRRRVRFAEHVLLWQDGLNLWDRAKPAAPLRPDDPPVGGPIPNCRICDDSYDYGEKGVSYGSANFVQRLRGAPGVPPNLGARPQDEENGDGEDGGQDTIDFNRFVFPPRFLDPAFKPLPTPILRAAPEEEQFVRVLHPHGRARQRAYVPLGADYEDIFLGFGSGHSALLAPGKGITAASCAPRTRGTYIWFDGAKHLFSGGTWGAMRVDGEADRRGRCEAPR